jgi:hypothetical protein
VAISHGVAALRLRSGYIVKGEQSRDTAGVCVFTEYRRETAICVESSKPKQHVVVPEVGLRWRACRAPDCVLDW